MGLTESMMANARKLLSAGQVDKARSVLAEVVRANPGNAQASMMLGSLEGAAGRPVEAAAWFRRAVEAAPLVADAHYNLGLSLANQGQDAEAERALAEAVRLAPTHAAAHYARGVSLRRLRRFVDAIESQRLAIRHNPKLGGAYFHLANGLRDQGRGVEALEAYRMAIAIDPLIEGARTNRLAGFNFISADPATVLAEHRAYGDSLIARAGPTRPHANDRSADRVIRLGILSPDLRMHSCAYFIEPLLARFDRNRFEVTCYYNYPKEDETTARLRALASRWRSVWQVMPADADAMIRADGIDVLVECSGHTDWARLDIMARKPAPVQGTWLGYPNTTGLSTIDFRLVDSISDPGPPPRKGNADAHCVERLVRIDPCNWCFRPALDAPEVAPPPFERAGHITFGSFNNLAKLSDAAVELWARVLMRVPHSRLLLKSPSMADPRTVETVHARFARHGVEAGRIERIAYTNSPREHLETYARVDIQLDSFPYHGTTTTCESFWQGVPVVTLTGGVHAARVSTSLLRAVGLGELAADTPEGFIEAAASLALDPARLSRIRRELRGMMERSPLRDEAAFARRFGDAVAAEFARWCAQPR